MHEIMEGISKSTGVMRRCRTVVLGTEWVMKCAYLADDDGEVGVTMLAPKNCLVLDPAGPLLTLLGLLKALKRTAAYSQCGVHVAIRASGCFSLWTLKCCDSVR